MDKKSMYACVQKEGRRNYSNERETQIRKENISEGNRNLIEKN